MPELADLTIDHFRSLEGQTFRLAAGGDEVEVTWALRREVWGQGFATEAGGAWLEWGLEHVEVPYVTAYIDPENTASRSVAERMGMAVLRTDVQHDRRVLVYARAREDRRDAAVPGLTT